MADEEVTPEPGILHRFSVEFETDHMIFLSPSEPFDEDRPCIRLAQTDYESFRKLEGEYWAWQTTLRAQYRAVVQARMTEGKSDG